MSTRSRTRLFVLHVLVVSLLATLLGRLWYVQVLTGDEYARVAAANRTREIVVPAVRGWILDDAGRPLVRNRTALVVSVDRTQLSQQPDGGEAVLKRLAKVLDMSYGKLQKKIRLCSSEVGRPCWPGSPYQPIPVDDEVDSKTALQIMERREDFPGVVATPQPVREYPETYGTNAAHVLGYLQPVTDEELREREGLRSQFSGIDLVGRAGLESTYDEDLRGRSGVRQVAVDSMGQVTHTVRETPATPGSHLVTSIDAGVQSVVEKSLRRAVQRARSQGSPGSAAAGVVLDVRTGRVVALGSLPTYDPSVWIGGISQKQLNELMSGKAENPLVSRATQGQYPPGSTFKLVSTSAAVESGYSLHGTYPCPGSYQVGNRAFSNFEGTAFGPMNLHRGLVVSCDTIFYKFAYELWQRDGGTDPVKNPKDAMINMAREYGFGKPTGIDLPNESPGRLPSREWKREYWEETKAYHCKHAKKGYPEVAKNEPSRAAYLTAISKENCKSGYQYRAGDAANFAIGQGDMISTPLQLANAYASLANGGTVYSPRIGKALVRPDGTVERKIKPRKQGKLPVPKRVLSFIRDALADVPRSGTAAGAFAGFPLDKLPVAGKTGTTEAYGAEDTSWFASFAPANNPRYAVVVMVAEAGEGSRFAAPAVREIYEGMYGLNGKKAVLPDGELPDELPKIDGGGFSPPPGYQTAPRSSSSGGSSGGSP
ncbi:MAG: penicillin-binding protein 2 [Streptosporangiales bacterium]|nr:penicillin-binding protein 2 [Streptosporangiales bacterium]